MMSEPHYGVAVAGMFLVWIVAAIIAWWIVGAETLICHQPKLTEENYIRLKIETAEKGCIFVRRDR